MVWHIAQPLEAGRLQVRCRVRSTRYKSVDNGLLLLLEQLDQLLLGAYAPSDPSIRMIKELNNRLLLR